ncbi:MAG: phosphoheptose isomerase [Daejeonella sp.]|uniref:phosphoheptose isomerase n=1 Tax=Daejeonella sp. TaxID=2805397 RepID=UPI0027365677|nr:phosphoheptose isomerase [Daejeonella sp.]MDP3468752.1 phosphoheptose isomerase [Daejeonella sp.]
MGNELQKEQIFKKVKEDLELQGFEIMQMDVQRPWGGFFVINEDQAQKFSDTYFSGIAVDELKISGKLSPKVLIVAPQTRLSWQYHQRRAEIWQVISGTVGVISSFTDQEGELRKYHPGDQIVLKQGERHRLVGLKDWGVIAEIWQHTDASNPSDESDITRVQDDFGR